MHSIPRNIRGCGEHDETPLLQVRNLQTHFKTEAGWAKAVDGVSFDIYPG